jgi:hypothetical protein
VSPRPKPLRPKRRIELNLYVEDFDRMDIEISKRRLPDNRSEIVSQALKGLWDQMDRR